MTRATLELPARVECPPAPGAAVRRDAQAWERVEWLAYVAAFLVWMLFVLPARGGWQEYVVPVAMLALVPSLLVLRPWRHCTRGWMALAAAPATGALIVAAASPYGDGGAISLSRWGYFGGMLLATAAFARTPPRRTAVAAGLLLAGLQQFAQGWLPWWGGGDAVDGPMLGTIYSANPFGSLMLGLALLAAGIAVLAEAPLRRLGMLVAPLCACAVVLSAARAAILLLGCGLLLLAAVGLRLRGMRGLLRCGAVAALSWGVLMLVTSSLFFSGDQDALRATTSKTASGQTLDSTTGVRLEYWKAAVGQFVDNPLLGGGSGSYMGDSRLRMPVAAERSPFAHNEVLGSLAEGGIVLGLPVLVLFGAGVVRCSRLLLRDALLRRSASAVRVSAALACGALLAHALVDFALSFPAVLALVGILLGLCVRAREPDVPAAAGPAARQVTAAAILALVLCGVYVGMSHDRFGVSGLAAGAAAAEPLPGLRDGRDVVGDARAFLTSSEPTRDGASRAEQEVARLARLDGNVEALRLDLLDAAGRQDEARQGARKLAAESHAVAPLLLLPYADRLRPADGADLLLHEVHTRAAEPGRIRAQLLDLLAEAHQLREAHEPGWTCTVRALQEAGALTDTEMVPRDVDRYVTSTRCSAWAARVTTLLGAPA